jgi:hypothetical protein
MDLQGVSDLAVAGGSLSKEDQAGTQGGFTPPPSGGVFSQEGSLATPRASGFNSPEALNLPGVDTEPRGKRLLEVLLDATTGETALKVRREVKEDIPKSYSPALRKEDSTQWQEAIREEFDSLVSHGTWELVELPRRRKAVGNKWVFVLKRDKAGNIVRYKAWLVANGYSQVARVSFQRPSLQWQGSPQ